MYRILIIEDDRIFANDLTKMLQQKAAIVVGIAASVAEGIHLVNETEPDLVFIDIELKGKQSGIEVAMHIKHNCNIPFIFLTRFSKEQPEYFFKAIDTKPYNYLSKGNLLDENQLWHNVEYAMECFRQDNNLMIEGVETSFVMRGFIFIKGQYNSFNKISLQTVTHIQSGLKYATIYTQNGKQYCVRKSLKKLVEFLRTPYIIQISQSYAINIYEVKEFNKSDGVLYLQQQPTPYKIGKEYAKGFIRMMPNLV